MLPRKAVHVTMAPDAEGSHARIGSAGRPPGPATPVNRERWTMLAAVLGSASVFLDSTVVNVALFKIGKELPASVVGVLEGQTYITSGYLATLAALVILAGALADYYGRRRVFTIGLASFGVSSVLCGLAPNLELLILFRVLQGATGALLVPCSLSIITATFEGAARGRAFGIWAAATSATSILGPLVGGIFVDTLTWRLAFLINVPIILIALYATRAHMKESRDEESPGRFDWLGAVVVALAVGGLAFGAIRGQDKQWHDTLAFVALGIGVVATIVFPFLMARRPNPLVPLSLFRSRDFSVINFSTLLVYGALYVTFGFQTPVPAGRARLQRPRGGADRATVGPPPDRPLDPGRDHGRPRGRATVPHRRAGAHGLRAPLVRPRPGHERALAPGRRRDPAARLHARRHPARRAALRPRDLARRRAADHDPHGLRARAQLRARRRRSTTRSRGSASRCSRRSSSS